MLELCEQHAVSVPAFGTLAGGFLTERRLAQPEPDWDALETWSQMKYGRFIREAGGWAALQSLGASLEDVVRTRIYLKNKDHLKPVADAHGLRFRGILPANTLP